MCKIPKLLFKTPMASNTFYMTLYCLLLTNTLFLLQMILSVETGSYNRFMLQWATLHVIFDSRPHEREQWAVGWPPSAVEEYGALSIMYCRLLIDLLSVLDGVKLSTR